jgi:hypothetical protein
MLTKSRLSIAAVLAAAAIAAPAATAMPADVTAGGENATVAGTIDDARGEHAASLSHPRSVGGVAGDQRSPDAVAPFVRPVVVETGEPSSPGFDWTSAIIGIAGGLALAVLAGAAVTGGRVRHRSTRTV